MSAQPLAALLPADPSPPAPVDRDGAIERARKAACWVEALARAVPPGARTAKLERHP